MNFMIFQEKFDSTAPGRATPQALGRSQHARRRTRFAVAVSMGAAATMVLSMAYAGAASASTNTRDTVTGSRFGPVGLSHFGMADPRLIGETAVLQASQLAAMKAMGITSVRFDANWNRVQYGGPKTFNWTQLDLAVKSARAAGMSVDLIIDGCPPWAALAGASGDVSPQPASS